MLNHSCYPNVILIQHGDVLYCIAIRDIHAGEEITIIQDPSGPVSFRESESVTVDCKGSLCTSWRLGIPTREVRLAQLLSSDITEDHLVEVMKAILFDPAFLARVFCIKDRFIKFMRMVETESLSSPCVRELGRKVKRKIYDILYRYKEDTMQGGGV